eukprot:1179018-Prorocentrum_minimum.AAC.1
MLTMVIPAWAARPADDAPGGSPKHPGGGAGGGGGSGGTVRGGGEGRAPRVAASGGRAGAGGGGRGAREPGRDPHRAGLPARGPGPAGGGGGALPRGVDDTAAAARGGAPGHVRREQQSRRHPQAAGDAIALHIRTIALNIHNLALNVHIVALNMHNILNIHIVALNVHIVALHIHIIALNIHTIALNIHIIALNIHIIALNVHNTEARPPTYVQLDKAGEHIIRVPVRALRSITTIRTAPVKHAAIKVTEVSLLITLKGRLEEAEPLYRAALEGQRAQLWC